MSQYTPEELARIQAAVRENESNDQIAVQRTQQGLVDFLHMVGMHVIAKAVANLAWSAFSQLMRALGWK